MEYYQVGQSVSVHYNPKKPHVAVVNPQGNITAFNRFCLLCLGVGVNPLDYLTELERNATQVSEEPGKWLPWNYEHALGKTGAPNQYRINCNYSDPVFLSMIVSPEELHKKLKHIE